MWIKIKSSKAILTKPYQTHPMLTMQWYQTPLEYLNKELFSINLHWSYYTRLAHMLHIRIFARPVKSQPWDRFPSDTWLCPTFGWAIPASCVTIIFSILFIAGWNFHFPTNVEKIMWRACSIYHAIFSLYGGVYYLVEMLNTRKNPAHSGHSRRHLHPAEEHLLSSKISYHRLPIVSIFLDKWSKTLPVQDPEARIPLRLLVPVTIMCAVYVLCRIYIYVEDIISLRQQPSSVYISTDILAWAFGI